MQEQAKQVKSESRAQPRPAAKAEASPKGRRKLRFNWATMLVVLGLLVIWQLVSMAGVFPAFALPSPAAVWKSLVEILQQGYGGQTLANDIYVSCLRILIG
ncbi:MAG: taurine transporter subunit, partial [Rhodoferax sp.]